ncbi:DUF3592 domain-containing protein [Streptomyces sp. NPDC057718]|uniref:DUF3592 domain-containing protein n=1 Tax=unclassified Streptomyces TaxID=2593676 RepID=UPI0036BE3E79
MLAVRIILSVLLFASSLVLLTNLHALRRARALESRGARATGQCVDHFWPSGGYVGAICVYAVEPGEEMRVRSSRYTTAPVEIGEEVEVLYRPGDPKSSMLAFEAKNRTGFDIALSSVMAVLWAGAIVGLALTV